MVGGITDLKMLSQLINLLINVIKTETRAFK